MPVPPRLVLRRPCSYNLRALCESRPEAVRHVVARFVDKCMERAHSLLQPKKKIKFENRPRWDGKIINLTPVNDEAVAASVRR